LLKQRFWIVAPDHLSQSFNFLPGLLSQGGKLFLDTGKLGPFLYALL